MSKKCGSGKYLYRKKCYTKPQLVDKVIKQMKHDIAYEDWTSIDELLMHVSIRDLKAFLPE